MSLKPQTHHRTSVGAAGAWVRWHGFADAWISVFLCTPASNPKTKVDAVMREAEIISEACDRAYAEAQDDN